MRKDFMFGVYGGHVDFERENALNLMRQLGIRWIRTAITRCPSVDSKKDQLNDDFLDFESVFWKIRANGFKIMLVTYVPVKNGRWAYIHANLRNGCSNG